MAALMWFQVLQFALGAPESDTSQRLTEEVWTVHQRGPAWCLPSVCRQTDLARTHWQPNSCLGRGFWSQLFSEMKHLTPFPAGQAFRLLVQDEKETLKVSLFQLRLSLLFCLVSSTSLKETWKLTSYCRATKATRQQQYQHNTPQAQQK